MRGPGKGPATMATEIEGKRRLPLWMLGVSAADQLRKSDNNDENQKLLEERPSRKDARLDGRKTKKPKRKVVGHEDQSEVDSEFFTRSGSRTHKRIMRSSRREADGSSVTNVSEVGVQKTKGSLRCGAGRTIQKQGFLKEDLKSNDFESGDNLEASSPNEVSEDIVELGREDQSFPQASRSKTKPITRRSGKRDLTHEKEAVDHILQRCETRKSSRTSSRQDVDPDDSINICSEDNLQKKTKMRRNGIQGRISSKWKNKKSSGVESDEEIEESSPAEGTEDGGDLTLENLISMAEEVLRRRSNREDVNPDDDSVTVFIKDNEQKKDKMRCKGTWNQVASKKKNKRSSRVENVEEIQVSSPAEGSEDGGELTMEDLMCMAEEYVRADEENERQKAATSGPKSKEHSSTSILSRNWLEDSLQPTKSTRGVSIDTTDGRNHDLRETGQKEKVNSSREEITSTASRTGDPATDMLNLFLGPLLTKPQIEERMLDPIAEDITWACDFRRRTKDQAMGEEEVLLTKKKSSLKDKVAMFLD